MRRSTRDRGTRADLCVGRRPDRLGLHCGWRLAITEIHQAAEDGWAAEDDGTIGGARTACHADQHRYGRVNIDSMTLIETIGGTFLVSASVFVVLSAIFLLTRFD